MCHVSLTHSFPSHAHWWRPVLAFPLFICFYVFLRNGFIFPACLTTFRLPPLLILRSFFFLGFVVFFMFVHSYPFMPLFFFQETFEAILSHHAVSRLSFIYLQWLRASLSSALLAFDFSPHTFDPAVIINASRRRMWLFMSPQVGRNWNVCSLKLGAWHWPWVVLVVFITDG